MSGSALSVRPASFSFGIEHPSGSSRGSPPEVPPVTARGLAKALLMCSTATVRSSVAEWPLGHSVAHRQEMSRLLLLYQCHIAKNLLVDS